MHLFVKYLVKFYCSAQHSYQILTQIFSCTLRLLDPKIREGGVPVTLDGVAPVGLGLPVPHHHHLHLHEWSQSNTPCRKIQRLPVARFTVLKGETLFIFFTFTLRCFKTLFKTLQIIIFSRFFLFSPSSISGRCHCHCYFYLQCKDAHMPRNNLKRF